jgi:hypothetical protein
MEKIYISIGSGCASATLIKQKGLRSESFPFDWILSYPEFVYNIFKMIFNEPIEVVFENFFDKDNHIINSMPTYGEKINYDGGNQIFEQFVTTENNLGGNIGLYNRKYLVSFPHDFNRNHDTNAKYMRRLNRLKNILNNKFIEINLVYISPSSNETHYGINGVNLTNNNSSFWLNKISNLLELHGLNFKIFFLDALDESEELHKNILHIKLTPKSNWYPLITQNIIEI